MSEFGDVHRLALPGLVSALLVLGAAPGPGGEAYAASLHGAASSLLLADHLQAQAGSQEGGATEAPDTAGADAGDDVPFLELNEALTAARSRLAELTKAADIAKAAGELREKLETTEAENRQLKSVLSQLQTEFSDLQSAKQRSDARIKELETASGDAIVEARSLDEQLTEVRSELGARAESLSALADESASEISRLQGELDAAKEQAAVAEKQQAETAAELTGLRQSMGESTEDHAKLARDLDATITELANTRNDLTAAQTALDEARVALSRAEQEKGLLRQQVAANRSDNDALKDKLQTAAADLQKLRTQNAGLERQVEVLKVAAGEATDAARQNLIAVETQINEINAALASVNAEDLLTGAGGEAVADRAEVSASTPQAQAQPAPQPAARPAHDGWVPRPSPPRAQIRQGAIPVSVTEGAPAQAAQNGLVGGANGVPAVEDGEPAAAINLASLGTDLPAGESQDAEALLSQLKAEEGELGLSMTVPGELLFAVNSEEIEPAAYDALASVAKLVDLYDGRDVLIVGHTDAVGDAAYNQRLSERRAALVKQYFVDNFKISPDRLQIEGKGEQDPINSNATADGRNANRRVEVVILN
ncbi:MAG: OmpA family protein [Alphaproteobacteria bacterium]